VRSRGTRRRVVNVRPASDDLARTGNPKDGWWVILECGHVRHEHHARKWSLWALLAEGGNSPGHAFCRKCPKGLSELDKKVLTLSDLRRLSPEIQKEAWK
jgi:hypothetical protein